MNIFYFVLVIVVAYTIGNWSNARFIARMKNVDINTVGSGNPGTMNMIRAFGAKWGTINLVADMLKGIIPALFGWWVLGGEVGFDVNYKHGFLGFDINDKMGLFVGGLSAVIGHIYPVFSNFKGGKGIASTIGVLFLASPLVTSIAFLCGFLFLVFTHLGSVSSFIFIGIPIIYNIIIQTPLKNGIVSCILLFSIFIITLFAHRSNLIKLFLDTERPVIVFKSKATPSK